MSKQAETAEATPKKRGTRLKGTEALKPCADCGQMKDRLTAFRPRWAGCVDHRNEKGRRYREPGCAACSEKVNGNIRQPRCIACDSSRPKRKSKGTTPKPTATVKAKAVAETDAEQRARYAALAAQPLAIVNEVLSAQPVEPEPEPVVVEAQEEPSPESEDVTPEPAPEPKAARPRIASMSDLSKLFALGGEESE
jgi:hypothetical protein